jgi:hypothetical protein
MLLSLTNLTVVGLPFGCCYHRPLKSLGVIIIDFETNTCLLWGSSALSSGVFPAKNYVLFQITYSRKIPPPPRFI